MGQDERMTTGAAVTRAVSAANASAALKKLGQELLERIGVIDDLFSQFLKKK